jgi:WD40 repeat protein
LLNVLLFLFYFLLIVFLSSAFFSTVYDYDEGKVISVGEGHADVVMCVSWSNDGKKIVTGAADGGVYLWNLE